MQQNDPEKTETPPQIKVEDLPIEDGKGEDVKGGPVYITYEGIKGEVRPRRT